MRGEKKTWGLPESSAARRARSQTLRHYLHSVRATDYIVSLAESQITELSSRGGYRGRMGTLPGAEPGVFKGLCVCKGGANVSFFGELYINN